MLSSTDEMSKTVVNPHRFSIASSSAWSAAALSAPAWRSPGVKMWTWLFQNPAVMKVAAQSTMRAPGGTFVDSRGPTAATRPSRITMTAFRIGSASGEG